MSRRKRKRTRTSEAAEVEGMKARLRAAVIEYKSCEEGGKPSIRALESKHHVSRSTICRALKLDSGSTSELDTKHASLADTASVSIKDEHSQMLLTRTEEKQL